jgi:nitrogen PTS system EIIA component
VKISELLDDGLIIEDLGARTKQEVLVEFADLLFNAGAVGDRDALVKVLAAREGLGSTGIGDGVAIPHGKVKGLKNMVAAFGRSLRGVDFDSLDGEPARLFFLLLAPEDAPGEHLKALARVSRLMKNAELRSRIMKAAGRDDILRLITQEDDGR